MTDYQIVLSKDTSDLKVKRTIINGQYWYYIISHEIWLTPEGDTYPGPVKSSLILDSYEDGILQGDNAALFRALVTLSEIKKSMMNKLHMHTNLFKLKELLNGKENQTSSS